ncbi:hypothetical protein G5714_004138 [Onychostoma macrolepis]|uniref:TRIM8/14/16/25/29/45/65 coiled-coil region domain-containing protein n=1 Tax=Onychostoma macrolepis TaxID=369639 RepID=A0A7J6DBR3_9TELE|nr:hypothetical protein G5714_004138 [Onychostoma macrolepis]
MVVSKQGVDSNIPTYEVQGPQVAVILQSQAERTERQIKQQFEKLHQFLRDEEEATITALREEEEQKKQMMKEKLEEMNRHISALSHTIKDMEEMMKASDVCFLKESSRTVSMERVQISSQPDPQTPSGALIHVPRYLGNLPFRVWKKMQDIVQNMYRALTSLPPERVSCQFHFYEWSMRGTGKSATQILF